MYEFFIQFLATAALKARERAYEKHGPFMPADAFKMVEQADKFIYDVDVTLTIV